MSQSGKNSQGKKELEAWQESRQGEKRASQYLFVPQILHKMLASTSSYCTACAKYFPALHRTPKLANSTSKYCFMPQSLHKGDREQEGNQYYFVPQRFRRQYCPAFFTTELAQSTSGYRFVRRVLSVLLCTAMLVQKVFPSTALFYKYNSREAGGGSCQQKGMLR